MFSRLVKNFLLLLPLSLLPVTAEARIYEYVDDRGKKVFVDRMSKIPAKYRDQLRSRDEQKDILDESSKAELEAEQNVKLLKSKLTHERRRLQDALAEWITPYKFNANRIMIPVKVVYGSRVQQLSLVMDTGASSTVVHKSALNSLGAKLSSGGYARVADGRTVKMSRINFDRVEIGPYKINNATAAVIDYEGGAVGSHGLLGMDFLFNARYELDRENHQIIWDPQQYQNLQQKLQELEEMEQQLLNKTAAPGTKP